MDRHRRIARTLFCLVASMTFGAAVLDWFQPAYQAKHKQSHQLIALLRNAINNPIEGASIENQWQEIQIHLQSAEAGSETNNSHFLIDRKGNMTATENWRLQKQADRPGAVCIGVLCPNNANDMTKSQGNTAQKLVFGLQQLCEIPRSRIIWANTRGLSTEGPKTHSLRPISKSKP